MMMAQLLALIVCSFALPTLVHRTIFGPRHPIDDMSAAMVKGPPAIHSIENTTGAPQSAFPQSRASPSVRRSVHSLHAAQPKSGPKFRIALPSKRRPWDQAPLSTTKPTSIGEGRVQPHGERREEGTRPRGLAPNEKAGVLRMFLWRTIGAARRQQLSLWGGVSSLSKLFSETAVRPALGVAAVLLPILGTVALWLWIDAEEHWV